MSATASFVVCTFLLFAFVGAWDPKLSIPANIPPTKGQLRTNFLISGNGTTKNGLFSFNIKDNLGTFTVRGKEYTAVGYYTQGTLPIGTDGARWVDFVGISSTQDDLAWIVFQCEPIMNPTTIEAVYEEDYTHMGVPDASDAVCYFTDLSGKPDAVIDVNLPALNSVPLAGGVDSNVTIEGEEVFLHRYGPGWVIIDSQRYITVPINVIPCPDCGGNCETCYRSPWYETHVVFYNPQLTEVGFGIFYLYPYNRTFVQFNYTLILPSLKSPAITFNARWYGNPLGDAKADAAHDLPLILNEEKQDLPLAAPKEEGGRQAQTCGKSIFARKGDRVNNARGNSHGDEIEIL